MLKSLALYSEYFLKSAFGPERSFILSDMKRFLMNKDVFNQEFNFSDKDKAEALDKACGWLMAAQNASPDGGMGSYHLINKWSSSYPETTGYIIPTLIDFSKKHNRPEASGAAFKASDFLIKIQKRSGGWQGGRIGENKPEIVFNTGQVIRGMIAAWQASDDKKYLDSAIKAGNWLSGIIHPEGYWQKHALMEQSRVYDTFVDVPLLQLSEITGEVKFRQAAIRNLDWVIDSKMLENGWFEDCDNTVKRNDRPILHTIAYTIDGLADSGLILGEERYLQAAVRGAEKLRDLFLAQGFLHGRYDRNWSGSEYMICTGGAQIASVWLKLYREFGEEAYLIAAKKMISLLVFIQSRNFKETENTLGAIPGSFPIWGRYEPFAFPNWATKFFCDALMLEEELTR